MNKPKLNKLTPEQEAQIPIIRDEFLRIGLSTEPADLEFRLGREFDPYAELARQVAD
jgi:hypothetical protein